MPVGSRGTNTMSEALQRLLADISQIKAMPDADLEFLVNLETVILKKLREPVDNMAGQMQGPGGGPSMGGAPPPPGAGPGGPMPVSMGPPGGGVAGLRSGVGPPNPDELRRVIAGGPVG